MKKILRLLALLTAVLLLLAGCAAKADTSKELEQFITGALPKEYAQSSLCTVSVTGEGDAYTAEVLLDLAGDESISGFTEDDYAILSHLEADYLLSDCLSQPPTATTFRLRFHFSEETEVLVEKPAGQNEGTLTHRGQSYPISFS